MTDMTGQNISHYKILEKIGEGGMGVVYKAEDKKLKRIVALKFLTSQRSSDQEARERFAREAQTAAALTHPNIITIHEIGEHKDHIYIAMEYIEGNTLYQIISVSPLPFDQATEFTVALGDALSLAHRKGVVHRDIKPGNIMITSEGRNQVSGQIKLLDFGLAKFKDKSELTVSGMQLGTLAYMSPEQVRGQRVDHRSDIFSLGVVFYEMLAGSPPFVGEYEAAVLYCLVNEDPLPLSQQRVGVPQYLERIIFKAFDKNPEQRYQNMGELLSDLAEYQYKPQTLAGKVGPEKKSIAVLPFEDISPGKQNEYLADGMTDELILVLSQNNRLRVIARTSVVQYKKQTKDVRNIGQELGVSHILEGTVRRYEDNLRITAQLIDTKDGSHLWADKYDGIFQDIFAFQEGVAGQVSSALQVRLDGAPRESTAKIRPQTKAYEYYLQGKVLLDAPSLENLDRAELMLKRALQLDPKYTEAYGILSICYLWNYYTGLRPDPKYVTQAKESAQEALKLDKEQPDALYTIANLSMKRGHIEEAVDGFTRVLNSDPNHGYARLFRATLYYYSSYFEEALREAGYLLAIDPFWAMAHWLHSTIRLHQGWFDAAVAEYEQVVIEVPSKLVWLALAYRYADKIDKAWEAARKAKELDPDGVLCQMAYAFLEGAEGKGREILKHVDNRVKDFSWDFVITVYWVASLYAMAGEKDEAFRWLQHGITMGNRNHRWFEVDPNLESIRSDPRFREILVKARNEAEKLKAHFPGA